MAYQHFYSRVPARVSMYHKADGFDTFAHSEGLERDFIERPLPLKRTDFLPRLSFIVPSSYSRTPLQPSMSAQVLEMISI